MPIPVGNSMYMAGLVAGEKMANAVGDTAMAAECRRIFTAGCGTTDELCWNGEYYRQITANQRAENTWQNGVVSEQLIGQWWSDMLGLGDIYPRDHMRSAIGAVFRHNFMPDCRKLNNTGYILAQNDDAGLVICSWPKGGRPAKALFYADTIEVGYEDQVAANLIYHGYVLEGIAVMKAIRDRYDGRKRDPYCQIECGGYYARSLANYGVLLAVSGYRVDTPVGRVEFAPKLTPENFKSFFSGGAGWGAYSQRIGGSELSAQLTVKWGRVRLSELSLVPPTGTSPHSATVTCDGKQLPHRLQMVDGKAVIKLASELVIPASGVMQIKISQ